MGRRVVRGDTDDPLELIEPFDPIGPPPGGTTRRGGSRRTLVVLGAAAAVALGALGVLDHDAARPSRSAGTSATSTSATSTPNPSSTRSAPTIGAPSTSPPGTPTSSEVAPPVGVSDLAAVRVPSGAEGVVYGLTSVGDLLEIDLQDGAARRLTFGGTVRTSGGEVDVLDDGLLLSHRGEVRAVPYADPFSRPDTIPGSVTGPDGRTAVLGDQRATSRFSLLRGDGSREGPFDLGRDLIPLAAVGDRVAVAAGGRIGLLDPRNGDVRAVVVGDVVDADGNGLVWHDCEVLTACRLRAGPWSDVGRLDLTDVLPVLEGGVDAEFSAAGAAGPRAAARETTLRISTFPEDGRGAVHLLVDLASGATRALPSSEVEVTPDGGWLVRSTGRSTLELEPVAGGGAVEVPLPADLDLVDLAVGTRRLAT